MATDAKYPIRLVSRVTGLPVETLRAWERRYGAVAPTRGERGRLYSEADLNKLRLLKELTDRGYTIGRLVGLEEAALEALRIEQVAAPAAQHEGLLDWARVTRALDDLDSDWLDAELSRLASLLPHQRFVDAVALPLMREVGSAWTAGILRIAGEHLASAALRSALGTLIRLHASAGERPRILFATPSGERHEFGVLAAAMLAATTGFGTVYLGPELPAEEIATATRRVRVRAVVLGLTGAVDPSTALCEVERVAASIPRRVTLLCGGPAGALADQIGRTGVRYLDSLDQFQKQLEALRE